MKEFADHWFRGHRNIGSPMTRMPMLKWRCPCQINKVDVKLMLSPCKLQWELCIISDYLGGVVVSKDNPSCLWFFQPVPCTGINTNSSFLEPQWCWFYFPFYLHPMPLSVKGMVGTPRLSGTTGCWEAPRLLCGNEKSEWAFVSLRLVKSSFTLFVL